MIPRLPRSTLFPYTTLFRSKRSERIEAARFKCPRPWPLDGIICGAGATATISGSSSSRSEEHTSELQSLRHLVCRLLLEKKKKQNPSYHYNLKQDNMSHQHQ